MTLYHYTCDHGHEALGESAVLLPAATRSDDVRFRYPGMWPSQLVWLTDLARPNRNGLGLTMNWVVCDRTAHRYRVTDDSLVMHWTDVARHLSREQRDLLEAAPGALPRHWWCSSGPVPVVYDPC